MLSFKTINTDKWLSCFLSVGAAKSCIHIWNEKYPEDERPNKAIEAVEAWLSNPCEETANVAYAAAYAADAAHAAYAAYAASAAAYAAAYAVAYAVAYAAGAASTYTYAYAADALSINKDAYIDSLLQKHLSFIIDYKIRNNQSFGDFEAVFEAASEADKEKLLFHMDLNNAKL